MVITKEDIALMQDPNNKETFPKCAAAIEAYKAAKDDESKKQQAILILQNFAPEKTLHILKTDQRLEEVRKKIEEGGKWGEVKDLNSFVTIAQELASGEIATFMEQNAGSASTQQGTTGGDSGAAEQPAAPAEGQTPAEGQETTKQGESQSKPTVTTTEVDTNKADNANTAAETKPDSEEEDPWIRSTLSKLRSKNLY